MKNDNIQHIRQARQHSTHNTMLTDILVIPQVVRNNHQKLFSQTPQSHPKRRRNYLKKIQNDTFLMNA